MSASVVSVVIPTYNRADLLPGALDSVLTQTYDSLDVVVVDDGSTDETMSVLAGYGDRIRIVRQDNAGPAAARNRGIQESTGLYVAFLDSDDLWLQDKLERQLAVFAAYPCTGMVGGGCRYIDVDGRDLGLETECPRVIPLEHFQIFTALPGSASNALIRREAFRRVGGFDETLLRAEDRDLWMRIAEHYPVRCVPEPTVLIRVHGGDRPNDSFALMRETRQRVNRRITDARTRRKAEAWMWFSFAERLLTDGRWLTGIACAGRSFALHPGSITERTPRLAPLLDRLLPAWLAAAGRAVVRALPGPSAN